mmetsp:Transcript_5776/g.13567  ORF Transcript_5776/g.13567 Transcript_5776/m.13567 type:complete len:279 (-) Transcript_5776:2604-3440(-)
MPSPLFGMPFTLPLLSPSSTSSSSLSNSPLATFSCFSILFSSITSLPSSSTSISPSSNGLLALRIPFLSFLWRAAMGIIKSISSSFCSDTPSPSSTKRRSKSSPSLSSSLDFWPSCRICRFFSSLATIFLTYCSRGKCSADTCWATISKEYFLTSFARVVRILVFITALASNVSSAKRALTMAGTYDSRSDGRIIETITLMNTTAALTTSRARWRRRIKPLSIICGEAKTVRAFRFLCNIRPRASNVAPTILVVVPAKPASKIWMSLKMPSSPPNQTS